MKMSFQEETKFRESYTDCIKAIVDSLVDHREAMIETIREHKTDTVFDFEEFARQGFLYKVNVFHKIHYNAEGLLKEAKDIINSTDEEDD